MDDNSLLRYSDVSKFIVDIDKLERMKELKDSVMTSLRSIRSLKVQIDQEKQHLKELLNTKIEDDAELANLLKEVE